MASWCKIQFEVRAIVMIINGHAHLEDLGFIFFEIWLNKYGLVAWYDNHALGAVLGVLVPKRKCLSRVPGLEGLVLVEED